MKKLIIVRHGKSEQDSLNDFDRTLNKKGINDSALLGQVIYKLEGSPRLIISSPARRAAETASIIAEKCCYKEKIREFDFLYPGSLENIQKSLENIDDSIDSVIIIGHNPASEEAASNLAAKKENIIHLPTSSAVCLVSDTGNWEDFIAQEIHEIEWILTPKFISKITDK